MLLNFSIIFSCRPKIYSISAPGAAQTTSHRAKHVVLDLADTKVRVTPLVLKDECIDLILGMDWLKRYQVMVDLSSRSLCLRTLDGQFNTTYTT